MSAQVVQAQYEQLNEIARRFQAQADVSLELQQNIRSHLDALNGKWIGEGSHAFFREMEEEILPALTRLANALEQSGATTQQIVQIMQNAEEDAAKQFQSAYSEEAHRETGANIASRISALREAGFEPDNSRVYGSQVTINTILVNVENRKFILETAKTYGISPALLAGIVAAEMDFDHDLKDKLQDGLARRGTPLPGMTIGISSVHEETRVAATQYLAKHNLPGAFNAANYDTSYSNRASFNGSVEAAAITAAMYAHLHGDVNTPEDMAVVWGAYRNGVKNFIPNDPNFGFESINDYRNHVARGAGNFPEQFSIGKNAYMSQPYFELFQKAFVESNP